jgi:hypothetical protein
VRDVVYLVESAAWDPNGHLAFIRGGYDSIHSVT